jgi:hypothetical protein
MKPHCRGRKRNEDDSKDVNNLETMFMLVMIVFRVSVRWLRKTDFCVRHAARLAGLLSARFVLAYDTHVASTPDR